MKWKNLVPEFLGRYWAICSKKLEGTLAQFTPSYITKNNNIFSPIIAVVALLALVFFAGLALGSFVTLFSSLLILYFVLTKVFGIHIDQGDVFSV